MVIPPGYFAGALGRDALKTFFVEVAAASSIPVSSFHSPWWTGALTPGSRSSSTTVTHIFFRTSSNSDRHFQKIPAHLLESISTATSSLRVRRDATASHRPDRPLTKLHPVAAAAPNIVGIKLTCGSVGKLSRLVSLREDFGVLGGFVDFLGPSLLLKSSGGITGTANVAPVRLLKDRRP